MPSAVRGPWFACDGLQVLDQGVWRHPQQEAVAGCGQEGARGGEGPPVGAAPPPLLEQVRWLQRLGRRVASELLPRLQTLSW